MYTFSRAALRASAAAPRAARITTPPLAARPFSVTLRRCNNIDGFKPLDKTEQPGVAPEPKLESEELLERARESQAANAAPTQVNAYDKTNPDSRRSESTMVESTRSITEEQKCTLWVGGIGPRVPDQAIYDDFGVFGNIVGLYRPRHDRKWITIQFETPEAMHAAAETTNGTFWHNAFIMAKPRQPKAPRNGLAVKGGFLGKNPESDWLYIGNIAFNATDAELTRLLAGVEGVVTIQVKTFKDTGKFRGFMYAQFKNREAARQALQTLTGREVHGRGILLDFAESPNAVARKRRESHPRADDQAKQDQ